MKTLILLFLFATTATAQLQILGGVSYSPRIEVLEVNKYSLVPSFVATIGDSITALNIQIGNVSKIGFLCRKGIFKIGINLGVDFFKNEQIKLIAELEIGILFMIPKSKDTFVSVTSVLGVDIAHSTSNYCPLNITIFKSLLPNR